MSHSLPLSEAVPHIEIETAGYITGKNTQQIKRRIQTIWNLIRRHYPAPGHCPASSSRIIKSSKINNKLFEIKKTDRASRVIVYLDDLSLSLRAAGIQCRLEIRPEKSEYLGEITIKIGKKSEQRFEEAIPIDLRLLEEKGFQKALEHGINIELKAIAKKDSKMASEAKGKYQEFKRHMSEALKKAGKGKLGAIKPYPLVLVRRETSEAKLSPLTDKGTILEIKTDECTSETFARHAHKFVQIEVERKKGDANYCHSEMKWLIEKMPYIERTTDSKEDAGMKEIEPILLPQNDSEKEKKRVEFNRTLLTSHFNSWMFTALEPEVAKSLKMPSSSDENQGVLLSLQAA